MVNFTYDDPDQGSNTCSAQQAAADNAAALGMFASAMYHDGNGFCFYPRLAHDGVIGAISLQPVGDDYLRGRSPWLWSYQMDTDREEQAIGAWACRRLADQPAAHASGLDGETPPRALSSLPRKFGVIIEPQYKDDPTTTSALESQLKTCGHPAAVVGGRTGVACNDCGGASGDTQVILNMKDAGVTSIVCLCWVGAAGQYMRDAESQSYFPEWLLSDYLSGDVYYGMVLTTATPDQLQHAFGLTFQPRQVALYNQPYEWAIRQVDPGTPIPTDTVDSNDLEFIYHSLLLLASGIQTAGPHLTPESFAAGLQGAVFPSPDTYIHEGAVGFRQGNFGMTVDAAEWWWSNSAAGPYSDEHSGALCYVNGGARHGATTWPQGGDPFFQGVCDSGAG